MPRQDSATREDAMGEHEDDFEDAPHDPTSGPPSADEDGTPATEGKLNAPLQKRRRVTRACDECRRKKIKCDDCTYDQPSNRRRNPVPAYVEALEQRVHRAEGLIQMIAPNLDLNDPALEIAVRHGYIPGLKGPPQQEKAKMPPAQPPRSQTLPEPLEAKQENDLESMIRAVGLLDMDENGYWDYHGHSSGLSFVRRMREQLGDLMGPDTGTTPFIKSRPVSNVLDSPKSTSVESPMDSLSPTSDLPPENVARELAASALTMHSVVLRIVHVPSFWTSFKRIYTLPLEQFSNEDHKFLPLLYSALAVGIVYGGEEFPTYDMAIDKGQVTTTTNYHTPTNLNRRFRYFKAARQMMDIADIRDMTSIQAVIFMILFLQSSAKLSQCYSYIGVALRGAIRMGLHRSLPQKRFNPLELEMRKRVFWTIRKLDVYIGAMLGLPQSLSEEDIDQDDPAEVDDEFITEEGIKAMPPGTVTVMTAFNKHTKLQKILTKIVQKVYPIHVASADGPMGKSYAVSFATIKEIEREMEEWKASLPQGLDPSHDNPKLQRAQQSLRVTYAFNQVLLYRPFLHFVAADKRAQGADQRAFACAASYINVSRNLIHLCDVMRKRGQLNGALWFTVYLTFFSILSLVYFAAENPDNPTTEELMKDALNGKAILASAAKRTMSADRCTATLDVIFSRLPQWMREGKSNPAPVKRKRKQATDSRPVSGLQAATMPRSMPPGVASASAGGQSPASMMTGGIQPVIKTEGGPFTPQSNSFGSAPYTPTDYSPTTQTLQQFGLQPPSNNPDVPDLSSMIFSSAEPFTYPSQPLTTFENSQGPREQALYGNGNMRDPSVVPPGVPGQPNGDNLDSQLYNMPQYMMQGGNWSGADMQGMSNGSIHGSQAQQQQQQQQYMMTQAPPQGVDPNWQNQRHAMYGDQQAFQDINLQDIFGSEWNGPMMSQGYGQ
ncbi:fungal specific transcription factor domain-containing protein 32 [Elsinoe australis]|uniref:Fungal specific transcription factor domain-containing protein 32 n=1 Tax=Elsinoe australis TaxID=40998 RepID=A0A4U7B5Y5_9PEZI|nr:fungal specific transcription factor domain-containing protein 32 [Elsinoe australis]